MGARHTRSGTGKEQGRESKAGQSDRTKQQAAQPDRTEQQNRTPNQNTKKERTHVRVCVGGFVGMYEIYCVVGVLFLAVRGGENLWNSDLKASPGPLTTLLFRSLADET